MTLILSGTDGLSDIDGSAATPAIRGTDANTGIFFGADTVGIATGGTAAITVNSSQNTVFNSTGAITLSSGTTAERPGSPVVGMIRYNTTESRYEVYEAGGWAFLRSTAYSYNIEYLVVAGGGGGAGASGGAGGGGGAGGFRTATGFLLTSVTTYTVTVGAGGAGGVTGGAA